MKKTELTLKQMVEAVKANSKEPWSVVGIKRRTWFDVIKRNGLTMDALQSADVSADSADVSADSADVSADASADSADSADVSADSADVSADVSADSADVSASQSQCIETSEVSTEVQARKVNPAPQWSPDVTNEVNTVGRGGVRYRFSDTDKYNEFVKEDAFRILERALKNEITHKPVERIVKPEIPEELLQYDQTDVPYDVWTKYIDESKGEHWGTFVMRYGRFLEPKEHKSVDTPVEPRKVYSKDFLF